MNLARVVGRVVATQKDPGLTGTTMLMLQPLDAALRSKGPIIVGTDAAGSGAGEIVIYVKGREAAYAFLPGLVPADAGIVGIVDEVYVDDGKR